MIRIPSGGAHPEAQAQTLWLSCDRAFVTHAIAPIRCFIHYCLFVHLLLPCLLPLLGLSCYCLLLSVISISILISIPISIFTPISMAIFIWRLIFIMTSMNFLIIVFLWRRAEGYPRLIIDHDSGRIMSGAWFNGGSPGEGFSITSRPLFSSLINLGGPPLSFGGRRV